MTDETNERKTISNEKEIEMNFFSHKNAATPNYLVIVHGQTATISVAVNAQSYAHALTSGLKQLGFPVGTTFATRPTVRAL